MSYTHQQFFHDVRLAALQGNECQPWYGRVYDVPILYKCWEPPELAIFDVENGGDTPALSGTNNRTGQVEVVIFADSEVKSRCELAYILIHELGHIADYGRSGHGLPWVNECYKLGIVEHPYSGQGRPSARRWQGEEPEHWSRPSVRHAVMSLPPMDDYDTVAAMVRRSPVRQFRHLIGFTPSAEWQAHARFPYKA